MQTDDNKYWYALRVTYQQEMKVKHDLDHRRIENFIPMRVDFVMRGSRKTKVLRPAIHNLIFVYASTDEMKHYREETAMPVRYIMDMATGMPVVIPERQMRNFIGVAATGDEQLIYLPPNPKEWHSGQKVRITGGIFSGYEGRFVRVKGDRRVVVEIPGVMAVATGFIHPSLLEPLENEQ